jgi:hypothetical protein
MFCTRFRSSPSDLVNMADSDNSTLNDDECASRSLTNLSSHTAAELLSIPLQNRCNIKQDAQSDHLEHASTIAACLDNDNYLIVIGDTITSCQSSTKNVSVTEQSAAIESDDYLDIIGENTRASDNYLTPFDRSNPNESPNSAQSEYPVTAATSQACIDVVYDSKYCNGSTFTSEARNYTRLLDLHEQQQEQVAGVSNYDNATETFGLSNYDNAGLNVSAVNVSIFAVDAR